MAVLQKSVWVALGAALVVGGCSSSTAGPCETGDQTKGCGESCEAAGECSAGLYCKADTCTADCTAGMADKFCGDGVACMDDGRCDTPHVADAGGSDGAVSDASSGGGQDSGADAHAGCGEVRIGGTPVTPNVVVIVDQSSSMNEGLGRDGSRWQVLKDTLLADDGLIAELQELVRFGVVLYSAANDSGSTPAPPPIGECPALTSVDYALNNLETIRSTYAPADVIEDTPTGDAIDAILDNLLADGSIDPGTLDHEAGDPTVFILATDGEPDTCEELDPQNGQGEAIAAVERAYSLGVRTFVIAVAKENEISEDHLNDLANAGVGAGSGGNSPSYRVNDQDGLRDTLRGIVTGEISCQVPLQGRVTTPNPCEEGRVELDGNPLECGDGAADGWRLLDPETIELMGQACEYLKSGSHLEAVFPCDSAILI